MTKPSPHGSSVICRPPRPDLQTRIHTVPYRYTFLKGTRRARRLPLNRAGPEYPHNLKHLVRNFRHTCVSCMSCNPQPSYYHAWTAHRAQEALTVDNHIIPLLNLVHTPTSGRAWHLCTTPMPATRRLSVLALATDLLLPPLSLPTWHLLYNAPTCGHLSCN